MNRREFLKSAALVTAAGAVLGKGSVLKAAEDSAKKPSGPNFELSRADALSSDGTDRSECFRSGIRASASADASRWENSELRSERCHDSSCD